MARPPDQREYPELPAQASPTAVEAVAKFRAEPTPPDLNDAAERADSRARSRPALTGRALAMTKGKGKKKGLKRQGY